MDCRQIDLAFPHEPTRYGVLQCLRPHCGRIAIGIWRSGSITQCLDHGLRNLVSRRADGDVNATTFGFSGNLPVFADSRPIVWRCECLETHDAPSVRVPTAYDKGRLLSRRPYQHSIRFSPDSAAATLPPAQSYQQHRSTHCSSTWVPHRPYPTKQDDVLTRGMRPPGSTSRE